MVDSDITMSLDSTLELDTIIQESNIASNPVTVTDGTEGSDFESDGIETNTYVFDPINSGTYNIDINGQTLTVEVLKTYDVPDAVKNQSLAWYPFDKYSTDTTENIEDKSKNSNDLVTGSLTEYSNINGLQAGVFKNDWLRTDSVTYTNTEWTVFIVYRIIEFNADSIGDSSDTIFDLKSNANLEWRNSLSGDKMFQNNNSNMMSNFSSSKNTELITIKSNSTDSFIRINGSFDVQSFNTGSRTPNYIGFGARSNGEFYAKNLRIGEFILYDGTVSNSTRNKIEGYLSNKWSISLN